MPLPDSEAFNILFVQVVEEYRCLYDTSLPEYSSKEEQSRAWNSIAQQFTSTAEKCKLRWTYLRGGLTRYLKKRKASKSIKQFYLWDVMQFVIPYLRYRSRLGTVPGYMYIPGNEEECVKDVKTETQDPDSDICYASASGIGIEPSNYMQTDSQTSNYMQADSPTSNYIQTNSPAGNYMQSDSPPPQTFNSDNFFERLVVDYISKQTAKKPDNPDLEFFKSILPDMAALSASQKRRFKQKVLQLLEDISNENIQRSGNFQAHA